MLSSIAANSNDIFMVTSAEGLKSDQGGPEILYVNDAFTRETGYSYEEVIGKTPRILQGDKTDPIELNNLKQALLDGRSYQGELLTYTKDGIELWVDINIVPLIE